MATIFQKQQIARRKTSDITRLANQYQRDSTGLTNEYETSFKDWTTKRDELMAPYNVAVDKYKTDMTVYEQAAAAYKTKLDNYNTAVAEWNKNPYGVVYPVYDSNVGQRVNGQWYEGDYRVNGLLINDWLASVGSPTRVHIGNYRAEGLDYKQPFRYMLAPPAKVTDTAPTAPEAPKEPDIPEFDQAGFDAKRSLLDSNYKREVDERKAAKLGAVQRKSARPLLQGT